MINLLQLKRCLFILVVNLNFKAPAERIQFFTFPVDWRLQIKTGVPILPTWPQDDTPCGLCEWVHMIECLCLLLLPLGWDWRLWQVSQHSASQIWSPSWRNPVSPDQRTNKLVLQDFRVNVVWGSQYIYCTTPTAQQWTDGTFSVYCCPQIKWMGTWWTWTQTKKGFPKLSLRSISSGLSTDRLTSVHLNTNLPQIFYEFTSCVFKW